MDVSELTLKLIILLIPGAIACIIFEKLTIHKKWNSFQFVANSILLGGMSYLIAQYSVDKWVGNSYLSNFWKNLPSKNIAYNAVFEGAIVAVAVGFACAGLDNFKLINKIGKFLGLTNKYGDENLYSYFLNAKNVNEVYIRDIEINTTYHGIINSFSETDEIKEIVLRDVKVYQYDTAALMYELDKIYLAKPKDSIIIELPYIKQQNNGRQTEAQVTAPE